MIENAFTVAPWDSQGLNACGVGVLVAEPLGEEKSQGRGQSQAG